METPNPGEGAALSVVLPTFGRRSRLPTVVGPLLDDPVIEQIVVVVDGCDDGSIEWLEEQRATQPRLVPLLRERSGGAQAARASGLEVATGEVVLFLDDDVLAGQGLAAGHLAHHRSGVDLVVVGFMPVALPDARGPGQFASYLYADEYLRRCERYEEDPSEVLRTLWWGNVSMRRGEARRVGLVAPGLERLYHEDQDFGLRCLEAGLHGVFDRTLAAQHLHSRDLEAFIRDARSQGAGRAIVHRRHAGLVGELVPHDFAVGLPYPAELLVMGSGHPAVASTATSVLRAAAQVAGRLGWYRAETEAGKLLRRVNQRSGAEAVWRDRESPVRAAGPDPSP